MAEKFFLGLTFALLIFSESGVGLRWLLQIIIIYAVITSAPPTDLQYVQTSLIVFFSLMLIIDITSTFAQIKHGLNKFVHYFAGAIDLGWIVTSGLILYYILSNHEEITFGNPTTFWVVNNIIFWTFAASVLNLGYHLPMCFEKIRNEVAKKM